jgi:hypothetical protein
MHPATLLVLLPLLSSATALHQFQHHPHSRHVAKRMNDPTPRDLYEAAAARQIEINRQSKTDGTNYVRRKKRSTTCRVRPVTQDSPTVTAASTPSDDSASTIDAASAVVSSVPAVSTLDVGAVPEVETSSRSSAAAQSTPASVLVPVAGSALFPVGRGLASWTTSAEDGALSCE